MMREKESVVDTIIRFSRNWGIKLIIYCHKNFGQITHIDYICEHFLHYDVNFVIKDPRSVNKTIINYIFCKLTFLMWKFVSFLDTG